MNSGFEDENLRFQILDVLLNFQNSKMNRKEERNYSLRMDTSGFMLKTDITGSACW